MEGKKYERTKQILWKVVRPPVDHPPDIAPPTCALTQYEPTNARSNLPN